MMARYASMSNMFGHCESFAAACTSAPVAVVLDTAILAVSIFIVRLVSLLVLKG